MVVLTNIPCICFSRIVSIDKYLSATTYFEENIIGNFLHKLIFFFWPNKRQCKLCILYVIYISGFAPLLSSLPPFLLPFFLIFKTSKQLSCSILTVPKKYQNKKNLFNRNLFLYQLLLGSL